MQRNKEIRFEAVDDVSNWFIKSEEASSLKMLNIRKKTAENNEIGMTQNK